MPEGLGNLAHCAGEGGHFYFARWVIGGGPRVPVENQDLWTGKAKPSDGHGTGPSGAAGDLGIPPAAIPSSSTEPEPSPPEVGQELGMSGPMTTAERSSDFARLPSEDMGQEHGDIPRMDGGEGDFSMQEGDPSQEDNPEVRRWLARELHDGVAQRLTTILIA